jgi:hypothetical protein
MSRLLCGGIMVAALVFAPVAQAEPISLQNIEVKATEAPPAIHEHNALGPEDTQAGSHPYALTTSVQLGKPEEFEGAEGRHYFRVPGGGLKDVRFEFPPGFVGNPNATPRCAYKVFIAKECPNDTAIGEATSKLSKLEGYVNLKGEEADNYITVTDPVYNMETPGGTPAEFGYHVKETAPILVDVSVRTGGDYGVTATIHNATEALDVVGGNVKIWGVPADPSHNAIRGNCLNEDETFTQEEENGDEPPHNEEESQREWEERTFGSSTAPAECPVDIPVEPLLTNPTSCGESRTATATVDSWSEPGSASKTAMLPPLLGCESLDFSPTLAVQPDGSAGSTPTGLNVDLRVPQESTTNPVGLGEADVRDTTVTLPAGVQISPSAADGLQACSEGQIGLHSAEKPSCPDASKIASVHIVTPLLEHELTGAVYLAAPQNFAGIPENPFSSLIAMYLVAEESATGVLVKLAGKVSPNPETGQLTTTFENTPQLPFSELKLEFFGTDRAPLATPALCGIYTTGSAFTPWSAADPANPAEVQHPSSSFAITSGPGGASCSDPLGFSPSLASGTTNINAGSFSNLTTTLSREDGQQSIQSVQLHYPPGLSGLLSGVKLCGENEANAGTCGPESQIGETIVSVGLGNDPFTVTGGKVYITGPYEGAPFGLSIVNPAKAGPFDLQEGRPVVVRAKIEVNPSTAALTITTNTTAQGYAIPTIIEGIPLQIKHVNVNITRSGSRSTRPTATRRKSRGRFQALKAPARPLRSRSRSLTARA